GFFDIPFDHLYGSSFFANRLKELGDNLAVVLPDVGGIKIARSYARRLNAGLVVIDKRRPVQNVAEVVNIIGDVEGQDVLLLDDLHDTAGNFVAAIDALQVRGANHIYGAVTHATLARPATERIRNSGNKILFISHSIRRDTENALDD